MTHYAFVHMEQPFLCPVPFTCLPPEAVPGALSAMYMDDGRAGDPRAPPPLCFHASVQCGDYPSCLGAVTTSMSLTAQLAGPVNRTLQSFPLIGAVQLVGIGVSLAALVVVGLMGPKAWNLDPRGDASPAVVRLTYLLNGVALAQAVVAITTVTTFFTGDFPRIPTAADCFGDNAAVRVLLSAYSQSSWAVFVMTNIPANVFILRRVVTNQEARSFAGNYFTFILFIFVGFIHGIMLAYSLHLFSLVTGHLIFERDNISTD